MGAVTKWTPERVEQVKAVLVEARGDLTAAAERIGIKRNVLKTLCSDKRIDYMAMRDMGPLTVAPPPTLSWPPKGYTPEVTKPAKSSKPKDVITSIKITDLHCPYHDRRAIEVVKAIIREVKPDTLDILGDFLELESLSRHPKSRPDTAKLSAEYYAGNLLLDELQEAHGGRKTRLLEGNHENRAPRYEAEWGQLDGMLSVPVALYLLPKGDYHRETSTLRGIEWVPLKMQPFVVGNTAMLHGVFESQYHAYMTAMHLGPQVGVRYLFSGHMHGFQSFVSPSGHTAFSLPWLGDERAHTIRSYVKGKPKPWNKGLAIVEECGATVTVTPVFIENGRALYAGRVVQSAA